MPESKQYRWWYHNGDHLESSAKTFGSVELALANANRAVPAHWHAKFIVLEDDVDIGHLPSIEAAELVFKTVKVACDGTVTVDENFW